MQDVRFGIIGCGNIGHTHLEALQEGKGIVCAGICDRIPEHAEKLNADFNANYRIFKDAKEMVESPDIDAVILAVPNYQHEPMFLLAAEHGKHILCEKPLTMTVEQGERMVEAAHKYGVKTQMGLCTRFEADVEAAKAHIDAGEMGDIYFANVEVLRRRGAPTGWFGNKAKSGGGPLIDIGVHFIDVAWYLMGKPKPVRCKALNYAKIPNRYPIGTEIYSSCEKDDVYNVEDSTHGMITFENGAGIMYQAAWSINANDVSERVDVYGSHAGYNKVCSALIREEVSGMTDVKLNYLYANCYARQLEAFARVVRGEEESRTPVEDGLMVQKMLNGLYLSAQTGKEIEL